MNEIDLISMPDILISLVREANPSLTMAQARQLTNKYLDVTMRRARVVFSGA